MRSAFRASRWVGPRSGVGPWSFGRGGRSSVQGPRSEVRFDAERCMKIYVACFGDTSIGHQVHLPHGPGCSQAGRRQFVIFRRPRSRYTLLAARVEPPETKQKHKVCFIKWSISCIYMLLLCFRSVCFITWSIRCSSVLLQIMVHPLRVHLVLLRVAS